MITDLDEWATQQDAVLTATAPFNYSTEYHGLLNTASTDATSADSTAEGNYNSAKATSDTDAATTASRL